MVKPARGSLVVYSGAGRVGLGCCGYFYNFSVILASNCIEILSVGRKVGLRAVSNDGRYSQSYLI
jgi:hypothetical protein